MPVFLDDFATDKKIEAEGGAEGFVGRTFCGYYAEAFGEALGDFEGHVTAAHAEKTVKPAFEEVLNCARVISWPCLETEMPSGLQALTSIQG